MAVTWLSIFLSIFLFLSFSNGEAKPDNGSKNGKNNGKFPDKPNNRIDLKKRSAHWITVKISYEALENLHQLWQGKYLAQNSLKR